MSERSKEYHMITDVQKSVLKRYYDNGMIGKASKFHDMVTKAAAETGLSAERVENWIGNEKKKRKRNTSKDIPNSSEMQDQKRVKLSYNRGPTSFNLFCSEFYKKDICRGVSLKDKNTMAAEEWRQISQAQKQQYKDQGSSGYDPNTMSEDEKKKVVSKYRGQLLKIVNFLEEFDCTTSGVMLQSDGDLFCFGSADGQKFLSSNPEIIYKFRHQLGAVHKPSHSDLISLFNQKYSKMVGKPSRVPYMKRNFRVVGLPEGIPFKKPNRYGMNQIRKILEAESEIIFYPDDQMAISSNENTSHVLTTSNHTLPQVEIEADTCIRSVIVKVVGTEVTDNVFKKNHKITEEEVEVLDLKLTNEEQLVLYGSCMQYFDPDAWLCCCSNIQHPLEEKGILIPVLSKSGDDELFWLFYCPSSLQGIIKASPKKQINGFWLNLLENSTVEYEMLAKEKAVITKLNMIKVENGLPLYSLCNIDTKQDETFTISHVFQHAITMVIKRNSCHILT